MAMNDQNPKTWWDRIRQVRLGTAVALVSTGFLVGGAAWPRLAAEQPLRSESAVTAEASPVVSHAIAGDRDSYADIVKVVAPSVVTIRTESKGRMSPTASQGDEFFRRFFGDQFGEGEGPTMPRTFRQSALGSGVVISADGYALTNYHVIDNADQIRVELTDGRTVGAKVVGSDKPSDLALLKLNASGLQPIALGNSDAVQVGDVVLAVGDPLGVGKTVTMGIISAKNRSTGAGQGGYEDFLQTDAPINQGNSGGALVNTKGELVGINSQILSPSGGNIGIGFAIPVNMARNVMDQLRRGGRVERAQLGVTVQPVTSEMAESLGLQHVGGVIVASVAPDSAAARAGIRQGDVISGFNGQPVHDTNSLRNRVADSKPGSEASVAIVRDGREQTLNVKLDEATSERAEGRGQSDQTDKTALGVSVEPLTPDLAQQLGVSKTVQGLAISQVDPDGRAAEAGIQSGDIIEQVNRQPVRTVAELRSALKSGGEGRPVLLLVNRHGNELFVTVPDAR
jgi:serine protease Do